MQTTDEDPMRLICLPLTFAELSRKTPPCPPTPNYGKRHTKPQGRLV